MKDGYLQWIDLDLDIRLWQTGQVELLDEDDSDSDGQPIAPQQSSLMSNSKPRPIWAGAFMRGRSWTAC